MPFTSGNAVHEPTEGDGQIEAAENEGLPADQAEVVPAEADPADLPVDEGEDGQVEEAPEDTSVVKSYVDLEASGINHIAHDFIAEQPRQGSDVNQQFLVGREGDEPELRADANADHGNIQVDTHEGDA